MKLLYLESACGMLSILYSVRLVDKLSKNFQSLLNCTGDKSIIYFFKNLGLELILCDVDLDENTMDSIVIWTLEMVTCLEQWKLHFLQTRLV